MSKLEDIIKIFKKNKGIKTDAEFGEIIGLTRQNAWMGRKKGKFTDEQCIIIARGVLIHPSIVFAARELQKEKNAAVMDIWEDIYRACYREFSASNRHYRK